MNQGEAVVRAGDELVTLINIFDVDPSNQQELVDLLNQGTEQVIRHRPGFVSVSILASVDGARVVNYAQWRSQADLKATMANPEAQDLAKQVADLARPSPQVYSVVAVHGS